MSIKPVPVETLGPITLDPADYWHLIALQRDTLLAQEAAKAHVMKAAAAHTSLMVELTVKYPALKANAHYTNDDATQTLTVERPERG